MLKDLIEREFKKAKKRGWDKIYVAVDLHETVFKSDYKDHKLKFLGKSKKVLQYLSKRPDVVLIVWSSISKKTYDISYSPVFKFHKINFQYLNENPLEQNTEYADFSRKFYFNILAEDKAGWTVGDWIILKDEFEKHKLLNFGN